MIKISVWNKDLSDTYLRTITQLGADGIDFGSAESFPGVKEQGYPDFDSVVEIRKKIRSFGLDINRVTLPTISLAFLNEEEHSDSDVQNAVKSLEIFAQAGISIVRQRFAWDNMPSLTHTYRSSHRGGYTSRGEYSHWTQYESVDEDTWAHHWKRQMPPI